MVLELAEGSRRDWRMKSFWVMTENRGGENRSRGGGKKLRLSLVAGERRRLVSVKSNCGKRRWRRCVGGSQFKARMEFFETRIVTKPQVRPEISRKDVLKFAEEVEQLRRKKKAQKGGGSFHEEGKNSPIHVKC